MSVVRTKSNTKNSATIKKTEDCSVKGVTKKFQELGYMTKGKTFTDNSLLDGVVKSKITQAAVKTVSKYTKNPVITGGIKAIKSAPKVGAYTARGKSAYDETCKKIK